MFNPNLNKNKSYDLNFKHKIQKIYAFIIYIKSIKFMSYDLFSYKFGLNIFPWGISSCLLDGRVNYELLIWKSMAQRSW